MPLVTAIIVVIFGSMTFFFHDEMLIKMKPTVLYLLFGGALLCGLAFAGRCCRSCSTARCNVTAEGWRN